MMPFFGQGVNISIFLYCTFTRKQQQQQHHHHHHHHQVTITRKGSPVFLVMVAVGIHSQIPLLFRLFSGLAGTVGRWKGIRCSSLQPHLPSYVNPLNMWFAFWEPVSSVSHCCQSLIRPEKAVLEIAKVSVEEERSRTLPSLVCSRVPASQALRMSVNVYSNNAWKMRWHFKKMCCKKCFPKSFFSSFFLVAFHLVTFR